MPSSTACSSAPEARLTALWYGTQQVPWSLRLASGVFGALVRLRRLAYRHGWLATQRVARPVIVVGNLTVGGTGKTPTVIWLAGEIAALGLRAGVVLRGYGGRRASAPRLVDAGADPAEVGDEAVLLAQRTAVPVVVDRDRVRAARRLLEEGVDVVVSDDGLQHLALGRDLTIVVIDPVRGLGNGRLLPAGPLREPAARLAEADVVLRVSMRGEQLWPLTGAGAPIALGALSGRSVHAIAGIGHPQRFFATLGAAGLTVIAHPFPDHHRYVRHELDFGDGLPLLMTEKDAVKCRALGLTDAWYLPVSAILPEADAMALRERLRRLLAPA